MSGIKKEGMNITRFLIAIVIIWLLMAVLIKCIDNNQSQNQADGFTIDSYNVVLDVGKNNIVDVTETIDINFYENGHHGIYKYIPTWLEYTNKNGKKIKRKSTITEFRAIGENYTIDNVGRDKKRIKIGSNGKTLPTGIHTYKIEYKYDMGKDPFKNFDEFIFHAYGDFWGTEIKNASLQINMPDSIDANEITFWSDKYRKNNITDFVEYDVIGNSIYAKVKNSYKLNKSLTVDINLPEGYFVGGSNNYGIISFIISVIIIISVIKMYLVWRKLGKDHSKVPQTIEFYPPENMDAAQVGYIYGKQTSKKLTIALIIQLASKGYIKIDEKNEKIRIINLKPKTSLRLKCMKEGKPVIIKINKLKDANSKLNKTNTKLMEEILEGELPNNIDYDEFLEKASKLLEKGYIYIDNGNEDVILKDLTETEDIVYKRMFIVNDVVDLDKKSFGYIFEKVEESLESNLKNKIIDEKSNRTKKLSWLWFFIALGMWLISFYLIKDLSPNYSYLYKLSFMGVVLLLFFSIIMERKTSYGEEISAKVLGFREYLIKAEKEQIDLLVEKNPNYFYDILPYTYVLDVSKKWIKKFEEIPTPKYDMGNFDYCNSKSWEAMSNSIHYPSSSGSGGSSSCGGGCSSCGGGCSSCGGGGSW